MKKIQYYISALLLVAVATMSLSSCSEDKLGPTIFPEVDDTLDPASTTYKLDTFLRENYLKPYNLTFLYRLPDVSTSFYYNLVPATYDNAVNMAILCKHLWFDVYAKMAGEDFLKSYGPRIIVLTGSAMISPSYGETVGLAEGGVKVTLFKVNSMDPNNFWEMNDTYFHTMHHEFTHILHQTKIYPVEFKSISAGHYVPNEWRDRGVEISSEGFVTGYAASEYNEDFAETVACYLTYTDARWNSLLESASCGWHKDKKGKYCRYFYYPANDATQEAVYVVPGDENLVITTDADGNVVSKTYKNPDNPRDPFIVYDVEDEDGIDGKDAILQKVQIARQWFHDAWNIDLDALRDELRSRAVYDINALRSQYGFD